MMRRRFEVLVLLTLPAVLAGCRRGGSAPPPPPPPPPQAFAPPTVAYYDNSGGIQDSLAVEIHDAAALREMWARATSRQTSPPPPPAVDFNREMVVVVAAGRMRPDDEIAVDSVFLTRPLDPTGRRVETMNIVVRKLIGCGGFNSDAFPVLILRMLRFDGPVRYSGERVEGPGCRTPTGDAPA